MYQNVNLKKKDLEPNDQVKWQKTLPYTTTDEGEKGEKVYFPLNPIRKIRHPCIHSTNNWTYIFFSRNLEKNAEYVKRFAQKWKDESIEVIRIENNKLTDIEEIDGGLYFTTLKWCDVRNSIKPFITSEISKKCRDPKQAK